MASASTVNHRLSNARIADEPKQMLTPIEGYEEESLLPLELACEPLKSVVKGELDRNILISKANSKTPADGLTQDESASIHLYTMEWKNSEESLYFVLNRTLRKADRRFLKPWFKYLKLFLTALFKLPSIERQTIWRGVMDDLHKLYPKGEYQAWWSFSSCTVSLEVLESPQYLGMSGNRTLFSIETSNGKDISRHSYFRNEDESLLVPGTYLEVRSQVSAGGGLHIIHLRECDPPYELLVPPSFNPPPPKHTLSTKPVYQLKKIVVGDKKEKTSVLKCEYDVVSLEKTDYDDSKFAIEALMSHNQCRLAHGAAPLESNEYLDKAASDWARELVKINRLAHSPDQWRRYNGYVLGENLASLVGPILKGDRLTDMWYREVKQRDFNRDLQENTLHFTQVVWKNTKEVGFGRCQTQDKKQWYGVALYYPPGNFPNQFAENVEPRSDF